MEILANLKIKTMTFFLLEDELIRKGPFPLLLPYNNTTGRPINNSLSHRFKEHINHKKQIKISSYIKNLIVHIILSFYASAFEYTAE